MALRKYQMSNLKMMNNIIKSYSIENIQFRGIKLICPECQNICKSIIPKDKMQVTKYECLNENCSKKFQFVENINESQFKSISQVKEFFE